MNPALSLLDYRRRVAALYAEVRAQRERDGQAARAHWQAARDQLFGAHPQSPLDPVQREAFSGLRYFDFNPALACIARLRDDGANERYDIPTSGGQTTRFHKIGVVDLPFGRLDVYWLDSYGGGLFLPFSDATAGDQTYGGGRYLLDTAKGADLGSALAGELVVDFNFAYHPSCYYNPRWSCPLAPPGSRLDAPVEAGERIGDLPPPPQGPA